MQINRVGWVAMLLAGCAPSNAPFSVSPELLMVVPGAVGTTNYFVVSGLSSNSSVNLSVRFQETPECTMDTHSQPDNPWLGAMTDSLGAATFELFVDHQSNQSYACIQVMDSATGNWSPPWTFFWTNGGLLGELPTKAASASVVGSKALDILGNRVAVSKMAHKRVATSAPREDEGGHRAGAVYVFEPDALTHIGLNAEAEATLKLVGENPNDFAGYAIEWGSPMDGVSAPLWIGSRENDRRALDGGAVYLVDASDRGSISLQDSLTIWASSTPSGQAGRAISPLGDWTGDGLGELAIAAPLSDRSGELSGTVYIVEQVKKGEHVLETDSHTTWHGEAAGDEAGTRLATLGDLNGDGLDELAIGAPGSDLSGENAGALYIVSASTRGDYSLADAPWLLLPPEGSKHTGFGSSVNAAGDMNGDGISELLIGSFGEEESDPGTLWVVFSPKFSLKDESTIRIDGVFSGGMLGNHSATCDVDGDGILDLITSAHHAGNTYHGGLVYLWYGPISGNETVFNADAKFAGQEMDNLGQDLTCEDLNDDGFSDVLIGAEGHFVEDIPLAGASFLYLGRPRHP